MCTPRGQQPPQRLHRSTATRAGGRWGRFVRSRATGIGQNPWAARVEGDAFAFGPGRRMTEAVVADGAQAAWQHMAQIARDELGSGNGSTRETPPRARSFQRKETAWSLMAMMRESPMAVRQT